MPDLYFAVRLLEACNINLKYVPINSKKKEKRYTKKNFLSDPNSVIVRHFY